MVQDFIDYLSRNKFSEVILFHSFKNEQKWSLQRVNNQTISTFTL
jgi:hypothetical protein